MKRLLALAVLGLGLTCRLQAQEESAPPDRAANVTADFAHSPATRLVFFTPAGLSADEATSASKFGFAGSGFLTARTPSLFSEPASSSSASAPAAVPQGAVRGSDDLPYQLALGISLIRFRSSSYYATAVGTSTSFTYFMHQSFGWEGSLITAFAPTIYANEHVKYFSYGAGPKLAWRRQRLQPWVHGIVGGAHIIPQVAGHGHNGFQLQVGGGTDYVINPRVSLRLELDWVRTRLFGEWQNNAQAALDGVIHF